VGLAPPRVRVDVGREGEKRARFEGEVGEGGPWVVEVEGEPGLQQQGKRVASHEVGAVAVSSACECSVSADFSAGRGVEALPVESV